MKYVTNDVPAGNASAFMPSPAIASAKSTKYGMVRISGNPGAYPIPSPKPSALPDGPLMRSAQPSYNSPDVFYPSIYWTSVLDFHPADNTVRVFSTNELPIPAVRTNRVPGVAFRRARYGGLKQVTWPPAPQAWQNINAGATSG